MKMKSKFEFVNGSLWEEKKEIPVARNCDVAIAGGGPSGLAAAIASARTGADTLLVESQSFLGGVATSTMMAADIWLNADLKLYSREERGTCIFLSFPRERQIQN